jgi:hypothetical protein
VSITTKLSRAGFYFKNTLLHRGLQRFDRPPILIGGCGRSGTTLLLSVLSAHPHIFACPKETGLLCPSGYDDPPNFDCPPRYTEFYRHLLAYPIPDSCRRWCEKTPKNIHYFSQYLRDFEGAVRMIHLVRDGRDVITSRHPTEPEREWTTPQRWVLDVSAGHAMEKDPHVLTIRYEDMVTDLSAVSRRMGDFLDEDFGRINDAWVDQAKVRKARAWGAEVTPIHGKSVGKWKDPKFAPLVEELMSLPQATELLRHYGYLQ